MVSGCASRISQSPTRAVSQGSVLGPILFIVHIPDFARFIMCHGLCHQLFADDTHVDGRCWTSEIGDLAARFKACTDDILSWMQSNRLQLNTDKMELIWCSMLRRLQQLHTTSIRVGSDIIPPSSSVCNLGVYIERC